MANRPSFLSYWDLCLCPHLGGLLDCLPVPMWVILLCHPCAGGGERSSGGADCSFPHVTHEAWVVMGDNMWLWDILCTSCPYFPGRAPCAFCFVSGREGIARSLVWGYVLLEELLHKQMLLCAVGHLQRKGGIQETQGKKVSPSLLFIFFFFSFFVFLVLCMCTALL